MHKNITPVLAAFLACAPLPARADTYDPATNILTIDSVTVGDRIYTDVVVTVGSILSIGGYTTVKPTAACSAGNFTRNVFNGIRQGMTLEEVNQVMGCAFDPTQTMVTPPFATYIWAPADYSRFVIVRFDFSTSRVTRDLGESFKLSSGF